MAWENKNLMQKKKQQLELSRDLFNTLVDADISCFLALFPVTDLSASFSLLIQVSKLNVRFPSFHCYLPFFDLTVSFHM